MSALIFKLFATLCTLPPVHFRFTGFVQSSLGDSYWRRSREVMLGHEKQSGKEYCVHIDYIMQCCQTCMTYSQTEYLSCNNLAPSYTTQCTQHFTYNTFNSTSLETRDISKSKLGLYLTMLFRGVPLRAILCRSLPRPVAPCQVLLLRTVSCNFLP